MANATTMERLARGLTITGVALLATGLVAIFWAMFFTQGSEAFLNALSVIALAAFFPGAVVLLTSWAVSSFEYPAEEISPAEEVPSAVPPSPAQTRAIDVLATYGAPIVATSLAASMRWWLDAYLGGSLPYASFLLAVAVSAWLGGFRSALLAVVFSLGWAWFWFLQPGSEGGRLNDYIGLGVFAAVALCIGGITAGLRASQAMARRFMQDAATRNAALESVREETQQERDRFSTTLKSLGDAVFVTDPKGMVTYVNPAAERLTGRRSDELLGKAFEVTVPLVNHTSRAVLESPISRVIASGQLQQLHEQSALIARDGREHIIEGTATPLRAPVDAIGGVVLVCRDVTDSRRTQASLEESEERFRLMADHTPALIWMTDPAKDHVYFNRTWLEFTGRDIAEEYGSGWTVGIHPADFADSRNVFASKFDAREPFEMEYRLRRHDGEYRWMIEQGVPRFLGDGSFAGYLGTSIDITDRKSADEVLDRVGQRQSEFLATLAYELRNPLAPIRNAVQILNREAPADSPKLAHAREVIERQCANLTGLVDELLDVSRIDTGKVILKRSPTDARDVVNRALELVQPRLTEGRQTLSVTLAETPLIVDADATRLMQAIDNLLENAARHTPAHGHIDVIAAAGDHGEVVITVRDDGAGMEAAQLPHLFEGFWHRDMRAETAADGLGLGLHIARRLVEMHGGTLAGHSDGAGTGSRFVITLPAAGQVAADVRARPDDARKRPIKVLVVDDNVDAADAIGTLLEMSGHAVTVVNDPQSALSAAESLDPDVILMDIGMPGMTGFEVAQKLREGPRKLRAKIVALTGYGQPSDNELAKAAGFAAYIVKPVDGDQLSALVEDLAPS